MDVAICEGFACTRDAEFVIFPDAGHPGDQGSACGEHMADVMLVCSSTPDVVTRWEVMPV